MGWLDKYDDAIIAQGGETIPSSREDYLRQQYQNHLKEEANKGRQAVQKGMYEAGKNYLIPAIKTAGSFTPAGPIIGLMDAKQAWDEGSRGWAIAGAAAEALPYAGKVISKPAIKITKDVAKALKHNSPSDLLKYNKFAFKLEDIPRSIEEIKELNKIKDRIKNASTTDLIDWKKSRMLNKSVPNYDNTFQEFKKDLSKVLIDARSEGRSIPVIHGELEDAYLNFDALHPSPSMYVKKIKYPKVKVIDDIDRSNVTGSWKNRTISSGVTRNNEAVSPFETGTVLNHELDHYVSFPTIEDNIAMENFLDLRKSDPYYIGKRKSDPYNIEYTPFFDKKGTEIKARLGQIKDLLGKTGNEQVTKPQLRAALKVINNQNKYNIDNNMLDTTVVDLTSDNSLTNIFNYQIPFFRRVKDKNKMLQYMNDATSSPVFTAHKQGGIIPKAQEGKKVKKSVIFAESPASDRPTYDIFDNNLPPSLSNIQNEYIEAARQYEILLDKELKAQNYLKNYLTGYTGSDIEDVKTTEYKLKDSNWVSDEEIKLLNPYQEFIKLSTDRDQLSEKLSKLEWDFYGHPKNKTINKIDSTFKTEADNLRDWYKSRGEELDVVPIYGLQDTSKVNTALKDIDLQDVGIMGHSGEMLGGIPLEWWNDKLKDTEYRNCILGSCYGDKLMNLLPDIKNVYHTTTNRWYGVNPSADSLENALFSTQEETKIKPIKGRDYNISNKYKTGGNVSYTPEYIEQLKQFENRPDNLAYHRDNKGIPTIGWGHRITEEELKRKAIKMGKEWIPYERFSGKEGRILADKLMEQDVSHHYSRLERQVGKDTLSTLPPEVQDVLLDITYNRGSLGDSLEYVKNNDIAGLREYLADASKGLKGGAKTRMEWRANRIPVKTLPPVEAPINYNIENQYVPEVLQSIAEQPSTQSIIPIQDNEGYRNQENYGKPVQITSNQSRTPISMEGVPFPILAMSDTGELKIMMPGEEHEFEGGSVTELPMAQQGDIIKSNQLRTFTKDSGWLNKYKEL